MFGGDRKREVVGALWGEEVIGVVVFERGNGDGDGVIYGWAVRLRYRGKGIGRGLLEKVAEICEGRVRFSEDHVHSHRLSRIPAMFNRVFDKREAKARLMLEDVLKSQ
jgi:ribosomal protein S18 acetylase RimI-like enzyme